jgi:ferric-dicitrate binding protein FerR (iron transport regulator)
LRRLIFVLSAALVLAAIVSAANPVGSVSSSSALTLRGARVAAEGIPNWPLLVGDEIATSDSVATVTFKDGSRAILSENTRARVEEVDGRPTVRLVSGGMEVQTRAGGESTFVRSTASVPSATPRRGPPPPPSRPNPTSRR